MNVLRSILLFLIFCGVIFCISPLNTISTSFWHQCSKYYINKNITLHGSHKTYLINKQRKQIQFTPYAYEDYGTALSVLDSLTNNYSLVHVKEDDKWAFEKKSFDIDHHIKNSLHTWSNSPYYNTLSLKTFLEYILPYRAGNEALVEYRDSLVRLFSNVPIQKKDDTTELANIVDSINSKLATLVQYDTRSLANMNEPSPLETLKSGKGSCKSLTQLATLSLRSFGIATTIDECPFWAHRASGHQWNVYLSNEQEWIPFNGAERNPDCFDPFNDSIKAPKIFRHTYSPQKSFSPQGRTKENIPSYFQMQNRLDVTPEYVSTSNISLYLNDAPGDTEYLYLSVFNSLEWKITSWSKLEGDQAYFKNMGNNNIIYLPVYYINGEKKPAGMPFLLNRDKITTFELNNNNNNNSLTTSFSVVNKYYDHQWNTQCAISGVSYTLMYWENGWVISQAVNADIYGELKFKNIPSDGLYYISSDELNNRQQRMFSIKDGTQIWY